ncbi:MAG: hypothetical protein U0703_22995 [Anaerolineae bacterium]
MRERSAISGQPSALYLFGEARCESPTFIQVRAVRLPDLPPPRVGYHGRIERQERAIMPNYICVTCGTQYPASEQPPAHCPICEDERQYVNPNGQQWTTLEALRADRRMVIEPGGSQPAPPEAGAEDRHRAVRASGADAGRQCAVGLRAIYRRRDRRGDQRARRYPRDCDFAPALSHGDGQWSRAAFSDAPIITPESPGRGA